MQVKGIIYSDLGKAGQFTQIEWVKRQFKEKLGIDPYPGTLNLKAMDEASLANLRTIRELPGIEIFPEEKNFCTAYCFKVLVEGKIPGAIIFPHVSDYPLEKIEVVAPVSIKETLKLEDGQPLSLTILI